MDLFTVFHPLWSILSSVCHPRKVFHTCVFVSMISVLCVVVICDVDAPEKEEYLLKAHKVIEAVPRALNRHHSDIVSTALLADGKASDPCSDRQSYEAIRTLHRQLDDDASGDIDVAESDEFLRDELQYENGYERHKEFHGDDKSISVDELWHAWKVSQVHNWTVDETVDWFLSSVELPEYEHNFRNNGVDGTCLPRLAINSNSFLSGRLGIKDPIHRQKIALKAMDVVLFGPPRRHNFLKDAILAVSIIVATGGCWFAYVQHKYSQTHMQKMMKDMEVLQRAEEALSEMQQQLNKAKQEQEIVNIEKQDLERRLQDEMKMSNKSQGKVSVGGSDHIRLRELEEQLRTARNSLHDAESRLDARSWVAPPTLQHWLQLTYELELRNYNKKKAVAEQQLQAAKEGCEKLRKKRSTFMGAFRITHGGSIDDIDDSIIQAKTALSEVTSDLQERIHRWKQIERLCGVPIIQNLGIQYLESLLKPSAMNGSAGNLHSGIITLARSSSEGTLVREESPPPYAAGISAALLTNIPPPPKYSKSSPAYGRKPCSANLQENVRTSNRSISPLRGSSATQCIDSTCHEILEAASEEDDQLLDLEEELTEGSITPHSCSSHSGYSDVVRPLQHTENSSSDLGSGIPTGSALLSHRMNTSDRDADQSSIHSDPLIVDTGGGISAERDTISERKISTGILEERRKKKSTSSIVSALKLNFSSSSLASAEGSHEAFGTPEIKQKKKKFFPQLLRKKSKIM